MQNPLTQARLRFAALIPFLCLIACSSSAEPPDDASEGDSPIAFTNVRVITMNPAQDILEDQTVIVVGDRISAVVSSSLVDLHPDTEVIDGSGRTLLPGLADMHVHISSSDLPSYVEYGVTSVRNCWGWEGLPDIMEKAEKSEIVSPTIHSLSPGVDGTPPSWPQTQLISDPSEAPALVNRLADEGWLGLKMYQNLRLDTYNAVVDAAKARGIPFSGHVPHRVGIDRVLEAGQICIEHLSGYEVAVTTRGGQGYPAWISIDSSKIPGLVEKTVAAGIWNCPTSAIFLRLSQNLSPTDREAMANNRRAFIKALYDAGAGLLIGTDSGIDVVAPGVSLLTELRDFESAGISRAEVLRIAILDAAKFLGQESEVGQIVEGMRADLVLLDGDPLESFDVLEDPVGTMVRGRWIPD
ncbi:MAG: amidohydrolase family protein [Candidatus Eisenbacteria bacterium]|uniref:Amidohydrolase family protein n=1 Tax=Eiseniibacteriota bacterium TaxID=2212470 RepID=A0A7Y2EDC7_UNCEI|nr:amidohydrolase family protein [Candidatus Eisenbacteria bacterium]